jgi:hypothetical protein
MQTKLDSAMNARMVFPSQIERGCATDRGRRPLDFSFEHDLIRKPVSTFRDHALGTIVGVNADAAQAHRLPHLLVNGYVVVGSAAS